MGCLQVILGAEAAVDAVPLEDPNTYGLKALLSDKSSNCGTVFAGLSDCFLRRKWRAGRAPLNQLVVGSIPTRPTIPKTAGHIRSTRTPEIRRKL
jgi:hypothetical protein